MEAQSKVKCKPQKTPCFEAQLIRSMQKVENSMVSLNSCREQLLSSSDSDQSPREVDAWERLFRECKRQLQG